MHCLVFDIETVPDVEVGRRALGLDGIEDARVADIMLQRRRELTGSEFLSLEQHRVVAIAVALRTRDSLQVWSLGEPQSSEKELIERFFDGIEKYTPDLVSWNGSGFDLPVLNYRALRHAVAAPGTGKPATKSRRFAGTIISTAIIGATSTSWMCCPAIRIAPAPVSIASRCCSVCRENSA